MQKEFKAQEKNILETDTPRCLMCGRGTQEGAELHIEPIKAKNDDGEITTVGGLTLCELHTFVGIEGKETISEMFVRLQKEAAVLGDTKTASFFAEVLHTFEKHDINGHVIWEK